MTQLMELFNQVRGILTSNFDYNDDPDMSWFEDLRTRRDMHRKNQDGFAHYNTDADVPNFPVIDKNGLPSLEVSLRSLGMALLAKSKNPKLADIDNVIRSLEKIIAEYRDQLEEIPAYRFNLVRTKDQGETVNNLVYNFDDSDEVAAGTDINLNSPTNTLIPSEIVRQRDERISTTADKPDVSRLMRDIDIKFSKLLASKEKSGKAF